MCYQIKKNKRRNTIFSYMAPGFIYLFIYLFLRVLWSPGLSGVYYDVRMSLSPRPSQLGGRGFTVCHCAQLSSLP